MLPIEVNGPMVGIFLKEIVRRAMLEIRNQRYSFEATVKQGYSGSMDDVFTTADTNAQAIFEGLIRESLPGVGLIGEEGLSVPCTLEGVDAYITIDPLDGTKAFVRRQSHGVGTMVALVVDGEVVSAWVGDINTLEMFGYRPGGTKVHRISGFETAQNLSEVERATDPADCYVLLRDMPETWPIEDTVARFRKSHVDGSSIGTWLARLWKGEYGAVIIDPSVETPWDSMPIIGISQQLGLTFMRPVAGFCWEEYQPPVTKETYERDHHLMILPKGMVEHFT